MVKALPCNSRGCEFDSRPFCCQASCSHTRASDSKQYKLIPAAVQQCPAAGKVTLAMRHRLHPPTDSRPK